MELDGQLQQITAFPPRGPEPERHEVDVLVDFDDVGRQPIVLQAYELVLEGDPQPGDPVTAISEGAKLVVRRRDT